MNLFSFSSILVCIICFALFLFIIVFGRKKISRVWLLFNLSIALWALGLFFVGNAATESEAIIYWKLAHIGGLFIAVFFYHTICILCSITRRKTILFAYLQCLFFLYLDFSTSFISSVRPIFRHLYYNKATFSYSIALIFWLFFILLGYYELLRLYKNSTAINRNKIGYLFFGFFIGFLGGFTYFLPMYNVNIYPIGNFTIPIYCLIVTYAFYKQHLMDIEVIIKKTLVFAGLSAFVLCCITVTTFLIQDVLGRTVGMPKLLSYVLTAIILIVLYDPVKKLLVNITDKFLFQKKYSYREFMTYIDYVVTVMDRDTIFKGTEELLGKTLHPGSFDILLPHNDRNRYISYIANGTNVNVIKNNSPIIEYLKSAKGILSIEDEKDKKVSKEIKTEMSDLKVVLAIPLLLRDEFIGVMLLGKKKSDEYYTQEDLIILMNLARTLSIALKNAEFIKERDAMHVEMTRAKLKEELATMAYGVSHQFNNKFQGIAWTIKSAEMVLLKANIPADVRSDIQSVFDDMAQAQKDALGAGQIVQGLLNFTKPDRLQFNMVDIASNLDIVLQLVEYKHPAFKEVEIIKDIEKNIPLTYAHLGYLQEAYFIVLDNAYEAIEYMKARNRPGFKGRITIYASTDKKSNEILVSVKDNGIGMTPDILENVRNAIPFFTTKGSSGKSGHGAGVNMLSKFIDNFHKGKVSYDSIPDGGTTVTIYLPITEKPKEIGNKEKE